MSNQRSKLKAVFFPTREQIDQIHQRAMDHALRDNDFLILYYNSRACCGMYGARGQWIDTVALGLVLKQRFGDPVVHFVDGLLYCPCTVELAPDGTLVKSYFEDWE